jgi:glycosyltransferase involved in cell wall biosynthesis
MEPTGYADEVRGMAAAADGAGVPVALRSMRPEVPGFREALHPRERRAVERLLAVRPAGDCVHLLHAPLGTISHFDQRATYRIARSMFETDALPSDWVAIANRCDELWVPSTFNRDTFRHAGVRVPITVIPGGVHTRLFTPEIPPLPLPGVRGTVFLSVFEWRDRKGWDVLLRGWAEAFAPDDDVTLVLRTYPPGRHERVAGLAGIEARIDQYLREACGGRSRRDVAPIRLIEERIPSAQLPALYRSATALVLPTRGEGWGRPFMEAMACGVPVIATRWSAHLDFMTDANSYLVAVDGVVPAAAEDMVLYIGQRWAAPSVRDLVTQLRRVHTDRREAAAVGARARADMVAHWGWERAGAAVAQRLREVAGSGVLRPAGSRVPVPEGSTALHGAAPLASAPDTLPAAPLTVRVDGACGADGWLSEAAAWALALTRPGACTPDGRPVRLAWPTPPGPERPPTGSAEERAWYGQGVPGDAPAVQLTVVAPEAGPCALVPPAGDVPWVVVLAGGADPVLPAPWVAPLRDRATGVLVAHEEERDACLAAGVDPARVAVVPPALDPQRWRRARAAYPRSVPTEGTALLLQVTPRTLGRVQQLVALYQRLCTEDDPIVLHLRIPPVEGGVGADAPDATVAAYAAWRERMLALQGARRPGMPFIWLDTDAMSPDELPALLHSVHALLSPGIGSGRELLAARYGGVPVIAMEGGAARRYIPPGAGWVVPVDPSGRPQQEALREALVAVRDARQRDARVAAAQAALRLPEPTDAEGEVGQDAAWGARLDLFWRMAAPVAGARAA